MFKFPFLVSAVAAYTDYRYRWNDASVRSTSPTTKSGGNVGFKIPVHNNMAFGAGGGGGSNDDSGLNSWGQTVDKGHVAANQWNIVTGSHHDLQETKAFVHNINDQQSSLRDYNNDEKTSGSGWSIEGSTDQAREASNINGGDTDKLDAYFQFSKGASSSSLDNSGHDKFDSKHVRNEGMTQTHKKLEVMSSHNNGQQLAQGHTFSGGKANMVMKNTVGGGGASKFGGFMSVKDLHGNTHATNTGATSVTQRTAGYREYDYYPYQR